MKKIKWQVLAGTFVAFILVILLIGFTGIFKGKPVKEKQNEVMNAINQNDSKTLKKLIDDHYPINFTSSQGLTPLETALNNQEIESANLLLTNGAKWKEENTQPLLVELAASLDDYETNKDDPDYQKKIKSYMLLMKNELKRNPNSIHAANDLGNTALNMAATTGDPKIINFLISRGAKPTAVNHFHETPFLMAVKDGEIDAAQTLFHYHNQQLDKDGDGNNIFYSAAMNGRTDMLNFLLQKTNQGINDKNHLGKTALMVASEYGYPEIVKILLAHGADPSLKSNQGKTALDYAKQFQHGDIIKMLNSR